MIRAHENPLALRAGILSVLVHGVLLAILLISFNWKAVQPASIAEVELWDSLPPVQPAIKPVPPAPEPPKPEPVPEIKPEPKPEPPPEPKAEIQLKKEPVRELKPKVEKPVEKPIPPKPDPAVKAKEDEKRKLAELQKMFAEEDKNSQQQQHKNEAQASAKAASAAASAGEIDKYMGLISRKIRQNVNKQLCGTGKPELTFSIALMPTGEVIGSPRLLKGSGNTACDDAVERAIKLSQPLPVPSQPELFSQFRDLNLKFKPNDDN
jgi:colicin import membrane protein